AGPHVRVCARVPRLPVQEGRVRARHRDAHDPAADHDHPQLHARREPRVAQHLPGHPRAGPGERVRDVPVPAALPHAAALDPRSRRARRRGALAKALAVRRADEHADARGGRARVRRDRVERLPVAVPRRRPPGQDDPPRGPHAAAEHRRHDELGRAPRRDGGRDAADPRRLPRPPAPPRRGPHRRRGHRLTRLAPSCPTTAPTPSGPRARVRAHQPPPRPARRGPGSPTRAETRRTTRPTTCPPPHPAPPAHAPSAAPLPLTACAGRSVAGADGAATAGDEATAEAVDWSAVEPASEITWWSNHPGTSQEIEQELIDRFEEESGITVNLVTAGANYDEVAQRFQAASQTDELPDVVIASDVWGFRYHLNDQILPLDDVLECVEADAADFQPALYADYEYDDQHWAVPYARSTPLFYYNKDLWTAAGLPDRGPETWEELEQWDASLKPLVPAGGSTFGLSTGPSWGAWWFENMIWGQGGAYSDGFDLTLGSEESIAGGQFLHELFHEKGVATLSADDAMVDFSSGLIASTIGSTGSLKGALDAASFEVGTAYLPDGPAGGGTPTGGTGLAIPSSKSPEQQLAAAMFLAFLTNTENTAYFSQNTGYMPVRTSAVESDTMTA